MKTDLRSNVFWLIFDGMDFIHVKADNMNFSLKKKKKKIEVKKWMYLSLESMLCFFWLFLFLFYTQCMYYLCFLGVHWLKRICYIKGYIILCMIPYLLLTMATFNRLHLLFHVLCYKTRKKQQQEKRLSLSPPTLDMVINIRCNLCSVSFFFFF